MSYEQEISELFELPPDRFTASRDELAKRLSKDGDKEEASRVKALRKPTVTAWALNQLTRRHQKDLSALIEAGEALRTAQRKAASGARDSGFQEAAERRRRAVMHLTARATRILADAGRPSQAAEAEIGRALEAASVDPDVGKQLLEGQLSRPPSSVPGFESLGGFDVLPGGAAHPAGRGQAGTGRSATRAGIRNAERQLEKAETDARRARMRADTLREEAAELARRAERAEKEARQLERAREKAAEKLDRAKSKDT